MSPLLSWLALACIVPFAWLCVKATVAFFPDPIPDPFADPCVCGHVPELHEHFSRHSGCAGFECECVRYESEILAGVGR